MAGAEHPATLAVGTALSALQHGRRKGTHHRDHRTRDAILQAPHWGAFLNLPGAATTPMNELRAVDRYLAFCAQHGTPGGELGSFLAFVNDKKSSMLLRTVRDGLENLLSTAHPAVIIAEQARSLKEAERAARRQPPAKAPRQPRPLKCSVPYETLPLAWKQIFATLRAGRRVRGRKYDPMTVQNMVCAVRQLVRSARDAGLPDELSLATVRAYDAALEARQARPHSCKIYFTSLQTFGTLAQAEPSLLDDLTDLLAYYEKRAKALPKLKERKLADLPDLAAIFDKANALLDKAEGTTDRREKLTLYVDAAALVFLSLIPLRNQDTVLRWGQHISHIGDEDAADWDLGGHPEPLGYYLDLRTSKRDVELSGPLAPIVTPFFDALILQGRDERLLPQLRKQAAAARAPVFPKSQGRERRADSLSDRWRANVGVGSGISRTRIHTMLGNLGEHGVRAALALCAQRSPRTAKWYQALALARRHMLGSQEMIAELLDLSEEDFALLAELGETSDLAECLQACDAPGSP